MRTRHILGISGGKDSSALAIFMRDKVPEMEYVFCDTGSELTETYEYIKKLEAYLNKKVTRVPQELQPREGDKKRYSPYYGFDKALELYGGYLPSPQSRWCTKDLKLKPFEAFIGDDDVINYVGIRYDENRKGYITSKENVKTVFPFHEHKIDIKGVTQILERSGIGIPDYYEWRTRSGCYFCFYQSKKEWLGLKREHPDLFEKAKLYEKDGFTWREDGSLTDLEKNAQNIENSVSNRKAYKSNKLIHTLDDEIDEENIEKPCLICHL